MLTCVACKGDDDDQPAESSDTGAPDAGKDSARDAPPVTATVDCAVDSEPEQEPNDTPEQASSFTGLAVCGVLPKGDVDYVTFTTPDGTKLGSFLAVINGKVDFDIMLGGKTFKPGDSEEYGAGTYLVKAYTTDGAAGTYRIRLRFDPL